MHKIEVKVLTLVSFQNERIDIKVQVKQIFQT